MGINQRQLGPAATGTWRSAIGRYAFLSSKDMVPDQLATLTIEAVTIETAVNPNTKEEEQAPALSFVGTDRLFLVAAAVNADALEHITGSKNMQDWPGHRIGIKCVRGTFFGKAGTALRVVPTTEPIANEQSG